MCSVRGAKTRFVAGDFEGALCEAGAILAANPEDFHAWHLTAKAVYALGDQASGVSNLRSLSDALADFGRPIFALEVLKDLEKLGQDVADILAHLAALYSNASGRTEGMEVVPPPIPVVAVSAWDPGLGRDALIEKAKTAMAEAWGALFTLEGTITKLPFVPILSNLNPEDFKLFVSALTYVECPMDRIVIEQGSKGDGFFIILEGEVAVVRRRNGGEGKTLATLGPGAFFGEMALVSRAKRAAEVRAREHTVLLRASKLQVETLSVRAPDIGKVLIAFCHARMLENLIRISPVLSPVPPEKRPTVIGAFTTDYKRAGDVILQEGIQGDGLYVIVSGEAIVTKKEAKEEILLATLGPGDLIGEISLLMRKPSTATVKAKENTALLFLSAEEFMAVTREFPEFLKGAFDIAVEREVENISILASEASAVDELVLL
jgi:CRP-like cAMP-binding protein